MHVFNHSRSTAMVQPWHNLRENLTDDNSDFVAKINFIISAVWTDFLFPMWIIKWHWHPLQVDIGQTATGNWRKIKWCHVDGPTAHWSDDPFVRKPIGPTTHWSENPLVRRPIGPKKCHWSEKHWSEKVCHWSDGSLVRKRPIGPKIAGQKAWVFFRERLMWWAGLIEKLDWHWKANFPPIKVLGFDNTWYIYETGKNVYNK